MRQEHVCGTGVAINSRFSGEPGWARADTCCSVVLAAANALIQNRNVLATPVGMGAVADDDVGRLDEGPSEVLVGLLVQAAIAYPTATGMDLGHSAGVAGKVTGSGEAVDGADLAI